MNMSWSIFAVALLLPLSSRADTPDWMTYCVKASTDQATVTQSRTFWLRIERAPKSHEVTVRVGAPLRHVQVTCSALEPCQAGLEWQPDGRYLIETNHNETGDWCVYLSAITSASPHARSTTAKP